MANVVRKGNIEWPSVSAFAKEMKERNNWSMARSRDLAHSIGGIQAYEMSFILDGFMKNPETLKFGKIVDGEPALY